MKYIVAFLLINLFIFTSKAQTSTVAQNNIIPPSPTAAALGKYADWPVSLYTGTPDISIPLYSLTSGKLSVPISLSYHASGIKVDEYASWVGLGWSLNCGGVITRTVRGGPDDEPTHGYFSSRISLPNPDFGHANQANYQILNQEAQGTIDTQPDVFMFNAMGRSFKFFIDLNNKIQTIPQNAVKIEYPNIGSNSGAFADADQWVATFEDGTKLYFGGVGAVERTDNNDTESYFANQGFVSSWYLKQVVPASGPAINFSYSPETTQTLFTTSITDFIKNPDDPNYGTYPDKIGERHYSNSTIYGLHIVQITSQNTVIKFIPKSSQRTDVKGGYALDSIKVYQASKLTPVKQLNFNYIYSTSGRLRLTGVTETGTDNVSKINQWGFSYNATNLPAMGSDSQDHWGYFNGKSNNNRLPAIPGFNNPTFSVADREAYFPFSAAEILTQINYPTGGSSKFNYEANAYPDIVTTSAPQTANLLLNESDPQGTVKADTININQGQYISLNTTFRKDPNENDPLYIKVVLADLQGKAIFTRLYAKNGTFNESIRIIQAGVYRFYVVSPDMGNTYCNTSITWQNTQAPQTVSRIVGGVRLSSLIDDSGQGPAIEKNYLYDQAYCAAPIKNADYSYPITIREHHPCQPTIGEVNIDRKITYIARTSYAKSAVGTTGGSHIGYGLVTVKYGSNGSNGYEINQFSNAPSDVVVNQFPFPPVTSYDYKRGLLLSQKTYDVNGGIKKATSYTYNMIPNVILSAYATGFRVDDPCTDGISVPSNTDDVIVSTLYQTTSEWVQKTSQQEDVYDNGGNKVTTLNTYYYDNPVHMQLTRTVTTKSDGKIITAVTTYPDDYTSGTPFIDDMKTAHLIGLPIEQVSYQNDGTNNSILSGTITQYQAGGKGLADTVYKLESAIPVPGAAFKYSNRAIGLLPYGTVTGAYNADSRYVKKLTYNQYDGLGNLRMLTLEGAPAISYQWGYNNQYPVAQATNAKSNDIFYDSFEEGNGNSTLNDSKTGYYSHTGSYSKALTGLDAGNYVLSYWQKSGAAWSLITTSVTITGSTYTIGLNAQIDDVRFYPSNSQVTTYTYEPLVGMTSMTDAKGITTSYEYDSFQRLRDVKDKNGNVVKHMDYHYQGQKQ